VQSDALLNLNWDRVYDPPSLPHPSCDALLRFRAVSEAIFKDGHVLFAPQELPGMEGASGGKLPGNEEQWPVLCLNGQFYLNPTSVQPSRNLVASEALTKCFNECGLAILFSKADTTAAQCIDDIVNHVAAMPELVLRSLVFGAEQTEKTQATTPQPADKKKKAGILAGLTSARSPGAATNTENTDPSRCSAESAGHPFAAQGLEWRYRVGTI